MKPIALVQYEMLYERFLVDWMANHLYLPDVDDFVIGMSSIAPEGLGKPLSVSMDDLPKAYTTLWWNYLFLQRGIELIRAGMEKEFAVLEAIRQSLAARLSHLEKKVQSITARDADVLYTFYDTFNDTGRIDSTNAWVDTLSGDVRLPVSSIRPLGDVFRMARTDDGFVLRSDGAVRLNGLRIRVLGSAVVYVSAITASGKRDLFNSEMSGESDVEFGPVEASEITVKAVGNGRVESAMPFLREYQREAYLLSVQNDLVSSLRGRNATTVRLVVEASIPDGTGVEGYVRIIDAGGSPGEWMLANRPLQLPANTSIIPAGYDWQYIEADGVYRSQRVFDRPEGEVMVGREQWSLMSAKMDAEDVYRLSGNLPVNLDEQQFESDASFLGFLRYVQSHPQYDSSGRLVNHSPVGERDEHDILFLFPGSDPAFYLVLDDLPEGSFYRLSSWFYSEQDMELPVRVVLDGVPDGMATAVSVNGRYALIGRLNGSNTLTEQMSASVSVRRGWNRIGWYVALAKTVRGGMRLMIGRSEVCAYPREFELCSPYMLRYDSERTDTYYSWYSDASGHRLEIALPAVGSQVGRISTRPPKVELRVSDAADRISAVQVMLKLSTQNGASTPVVHSYRLEVF